MRIGAVATSSHASSCWLSQPPPSIGVHEMPLDRVGRRERDVVAALHHAGAAAFAEQALHRDGDVELGPRLLGVQRREQARAAGAEDQDVGVESLHAHSLCTAAGNLRRAEAPLFLKARGAPLSLFLSPKRDGAPGKRQERLRGALDGPCGRPPRATASPCYQGSAAWGRAGPVTAGPGASPALHRVGRCIGQRILGIRTDGLYSYIGRCQAARGPGWCPNLNGH